MDLFVSRQIVFPSSEAPKKLENFLQKRFPIGYVKKLFRKNAVRLNGQRPRPGDLARPGDRVLLYLPFNKSSRSPKPPPSKLPILFEDDDLLIINKPPGIAVHEGKETLKRESVLGILEAIYRPRAIIPKLVHRLDRDTSGLLVVAKNDAAARRLEMLFEQGKVAKDYLCLLVGRLSTNEGRIDLPLPGREGKPARAVTRYRIKKKFPGMTLVEARLETGRMHQIRLHFAKLGHPVVMDQQHGDFAFNKSFRKKYGLKRQFLHASRIGFDYGGKPRTWTAPPWDDLERTLKNLDGDLRD